MTRLRVQCFTISIDGYGAGPGQDHDNPLGNGGTRLHEWQFNTRTFNRTFGSDGGMTGVDDELVAAGAKNVGAWIIGRNMFGPPLHPTCRWREGRSCDAGPVGWFRRVGAVVSGERDEVAESPDAERRPWRDA